MNVIDRRERMSVHFIDSMHMHGAHALSRQTSESEFIVHVNMGCGYPSIRPLRHDKSLFHVNISGNT